jgi:hypothetical protein
MDELLHLTRGHALELWPARSKLPRLQPVDLHSRNGLIRRDEAGGDEVDGPRQSPQIGTNGEVLFQGASVRPPLNH